MFKIGDIIVYGTQGICKIDCIEIKHIEKKTVNYYVLKPLFNENTAVFVPVENQTLTARMQPVLTALEAKALITDSTQVEIIKIQDETKKREEYKNILASNNRMKLVSLIKTIRLDKENRRQRGKKLNIIDEQTLRKAEQLLYNELAFVFDIEPQSVEGVIKF